MKVLCSIEGQPFKSGDLMSPGLLILAVKEDILLSESGQQVLNDQSL